MGFDVLYLPPIHPIGHSFRKGKNNSPEAAPGEVGSPWAIGSAEGGHTSIHPQLGAMDDFLALVERAREMWPRDRPRHRVSNLSRSSLGYGAP